MQSMDDSLLRICQSGLITGEEAVYRAENKTLMKQALALN